MKVTYSSNNSGGGWWLTDDNWRALEAAGWKVEWMKSRWLGALAKSASLECETPGDAMRSFEKATGKDVSNEGCNCCGAPHSFGWGGGDTGIERGHASGEGCLGHLFPGTRIPASLREALEDK